MVGTFFLQAALLLLPTSTSVAGASSLKTKEKFRKTFEALKHTTSASDQQAAVVNLLKRVIGENATSFFEIVIETNEKAWDGERTKIEAARNPGASVRITATSATTAAFGAQWYLRTYCNAHFSWDEHRLELPDVLPKPPSATVLSSIGKFRYYANICTYSYSHVWWDWPKWETHIDWLALNGINFILMPVGQEYFWNKVYKEMGLSDEEVQSYFTGPAFLAWNQMGNVDKWGSPLSSAWLSSQLELLRKIVARMTSLGMTPIFGALAGHVPKGVSRIFPKANITYLGSWGNFNCNYSCTAYLSPTDPLFALIQRSYIKELLEEFPGVSHAYSADPFNEMVPSSYKADYVRSIALGIYNSLLKADPQAIWVLQGWFLYSDPQWILTNASAAFLEAVPRGRVIVLDLYAEEVQIYAKTKSFYGQPYIWCMLHNFGGNDGLWASVDHVNQGVQAAVEFPGSSLIGTGITMEGIYQNYPIYQFILDRSWTAGLLDKTEWIKQYALQRYGIRNTNVQQAWISLWNTVYSCNITACTASTALLTDVPRLDLQQQRWYSLEVLCQSWKAFADERRHFPAGSLSVYDHDLVDLTRQLLVDIMPMLYQKSVTAYRQSNITNFLASTDELLELIQDLDGILNTHKDFLLGPWIARALQAATSDEERVQFRMNMKNQLTLWGPDGNILDYARKHWSGLVRDYYLRRWQLFVRFLLLDLAKVRPFDQTEFNGAVFERVEQPFSQSPLNYNVDPEHDLDDMLVLVRQKYYQPFCS